MRWAYVASLGGSVFFTLVCNSAIGVLFIKELGGSDFQAMLPASLFMLARFVQLPVSMKIPPGKGKSFMMNCCNIAVVFGVIAYLLPSILEKSSLSVTIFLVFFFVAISVNTAGMVFWFPMLHDIVPEHTRGRFFGKMRSIWQSFCVVFVLACGVFLGKNPELWQFQVVFLIAVAFLASRSWIIKRIPTGNSLAGEMDFDHWKHYIKNVLKQKVLLKFLIYYMILGFFMGVLGDPLVLYIKYRGFPASENIFIYCFKIFGTIASLFVAGILVDKFGRKRIFMASHLVLCAMCFFVVFIGTMPKEAAMFLLPVALVISGAVMAASGIALIAQLFFLIPDQGRAFFLSFSWIIIGISRAVSPLFVGKILDRAGDGWTISLFSIQWDIFQFIFGVTGVMMFLALSMICLVKDVKQKSALPKDQ